MSDIVIVTITKKEELSITQEDVQIVISKENVCSFDAMRIRKWLDENYPLPSERVYTGYQYTGKK